MRSWLAAVFWTLLILAVCWLPLPMFPLGDGGEHPKRFPHLDKVFHAGIFAVFALLWLRASSARIRFVAVVLAGIALAAITEYGQSLPIVGRDGDVADGMSDVLGVLLACPLALHLSRRGGVEPPVAAAASN